MNKKDSMYQSVKILFRILSRLMACIFKLSFDNFIALKQILNFSDFASSIFVCFATFNYSYPPR